MEEYKSLNHCKYLIQYHIIFCPKFRFNVLKGDIETRLKELILHISSIYDFKIIEMEVMSDHVHLFVSCKPTVAPTDIVRMLKSITARRLFEEFPKLKKFYSRCGVLWSKGYFVSSIGNASPETIKRYIQEQKDK
jgi:putative transposase